MGAPGQTTEQACQANREQVAQGGLTIKGRGGIPPAPELPLDSHNILVNGEIDDSTVEIPEPIQTSQGKIQPAMGAIVTESGEVILTPYPTDNLKQRIPQKRNCA